MTDTESKMIEDQKTIDAVTAKLTGRSGVFDHEATNTREIWEHGRLKHQRPRAGCDGLFFKTWGTFPDYTDD